MQHQLHFKKLRTHIIKVIKSEHHVSNLETYISQGVVPKGLVLKASPLTPGEKSKRFKSRWNFILYSSSLNLMDLLYDEAKHKLKDLQSKFENIFSRSKRELSTADIDIILTRLLDIRRIKTKALHKIQMRKFIRDEIHVKFSTSNTPTGLETEHPITGVETEHPITGLETEHPISSLFHSNKGNTKNKKSRNRRFKRKKEHSQVISETVVNLSSVNLTEAETRVLSKGLNFCPTPGNINSMQLEDDLNYFARSLRIKEHFFNLNSEENNSSCRDLEEEVEESYTPKFRKKSSWIPKPSKCSTLEHVIDKKIRCYQIVSYIEF